MSLQPFLATFRCFIHTETEVEAVIATDELAEVIEDFLDAEDGDRVELTQLLPLTLDVSADETLAILSKARNALIKTRIKQCWDTAQALDQVIHSLRHRDDGLGMIPPYDYGGFIDLAKSVLDGGTPV